MDTLIDYLAEARLAYQRNDWRASYAAFVRADGLGPMPTDDLDAYGATAWRLGHGNEAVRLTERTYDRLVRTDPAAAAMKAAVLALQWRARGHHALSRLWSDRARGLLADAAVTRTHGYLAYLDAAYALTAGDDVALTRAATTLHHAVTETADTTLAVLEQAVDGIAALLHARAAEGYRLLDDALVRVVDDRLSLDWAGDVYRLVLRPYTPADTRHRQAWTESMRRWSVVTGVVIKTDAGMSA
jgi:hypothetical protein